MEFDELADDLLNASISIEATSTKKRHQHENNTFLMKYIKF